VAIDDVGGTGLHHIYLVQRCRGVVGVAEVDGVEVFPANSQEASCRGVVEQEHRHDGSVGCCLRDEDGRTGTQWINDFQDVILDRASERVH
jgi:hypothetical protein